MNTKRSTLLVLIFCFAVGTPLITISVLSQSIDRTQNPNIASAGIAKSLTQEVGAGRGDIQTSDSSLFIIRRDPFRSILRGRQLFQRKFLRSQGQGPLAGPDGTGDINSNLALGAGLAVFCKPLGGTVYSAEGVAEPNPEHRSWTSGSVCASR